MLNQATYDEPCMYMLRCRVCVIWRFHSCTVYVTGRVETI